MNASKKRFISECLSVSIVVYVLIRIQNLYWNTAISYIILSYSIIKKGFQKSGIKNYETRKLFSLLKFFTGRNGELLKSFTLSRKCHKLYNIKRKTKFTHVWIRPKDEKFTGNNDEFKFYNEMFFWIIHESSCRSYYRGKQRTWICMTVNISNFLYLYS